MIGDDRPVTTGTERRTALLARLEALTERPLTALALLLIPVLLAPYLFDLSDGTKDTLLAIDYLIWGAFAADLAVKLAVAPDRRRYLRAHWLNVLLVVLPMLRPLRIVQSMPAVRVLYAGRAAVTTARVLMGVRRLQARRGVRYVVMTALVVIVAAGSLATVFERNHADSNIRTLPDGLWWAVTTVTTVGYGDTFPRSPAGRGVGVALMLIGIGLFGALTANLAAILMEGAEDEIATQLREVNERLRRLEERLADDPRGRVPADPGSDPAAKPLREVVRR